MRRRYCSASARRVSSSSAVKLVPASSSRRCSVRALKASARATSACVGVPAGRLSRMRCRTCATMSLRSSRARYSSARRSVATATSGLAVGSARVDVLAPAHHARGWGFPHDRRTGTTPRTARGPPAARAPARPRAARTRRRRSAGTAAPRPRRASPEASPPGAGASGPNTYVMRMSAAALVDAQRPQLGQHPRVAAHPPEPLAERRAREPRVAERVQRRPVHLARDVDPERGIADHLLGHSLEPQRRSHGHALAGNAEHGRIDAGSAEDRPPGRSAAPPARATG